MNKIALEQKRLGLAKGEVMVLRRLCAGRNLHEIAKERGCTASTVRSYLCRIKAQLMPIGMLWTDEYLIVYGKKHVLPYYPEERIP